ncbi:Na(+)/H(+) antiporter NhaA [Paractinoplanes rishiriensis]|uniref:Na(+)/H(+) antiporter NhaA n=2 Tax=Paractinoplanes rishiriensis TaxID=1050105 RepID=A0A919K5B0_9ACTN|nr:Na(+)/H(+) antiporter NhaA [Actinoplanes rishiriensis]
MSTWNEAKFVTEALRTETVGGVLLLLGAALALIWANTPWVDAYQQVRHFVPWPGGQALLHLDLDLAHWAGDGLLAIFFFVVGLELKREFVAGDLRNPRQAALPIVAAVGGMAVPAVIFALINMGDRAALQGWAVPTATDIAFALAVLAVIGSHLPLGLRAFLLTLAVVDDLLAITIIALFYTDDFQILFLLGSLLPIAVFALLVQRGKTWWWALIPLAVTAWTLMHASGVHATIAGVLLGFTVPVAARAGAEHGMAEHLEHVWRPVSAGFAVPVFAFFAAGVSLRGTDVGTIATDPIVVGIVAGLVLGKVIGILGSSFLMARFTRAELDEELSWTDLFGVSLLAGIGFTVSLLIGELAFGAGTDRDSAAKVAVVAASVIAATLAAIVLSRRNTVYRRLHERATHDADADGIPDIYQTTPQQQERNS